MTSSPDGGQRVWNGLTSAPMRASLVVIMVEALYEVGRAATQESQSKQQQKLASTRGSSKRWSGVGKEEERKGIKEERENGVDKKEA